jgi:hypothetical protein
MSDNPNAPLVHKHPQNDDDEKPVELNGKPLVHKAPEPAAEPETSVSKLFDSLEEEAKRRMTKPTAKLEAAAQSEAKPNDKPTAV